MNVKRQFIVTLTYLDGEGVDAGPDPEAIAGVVSEGLNSRDYPGEVWVEAERAVTEDLALERRLEAAYATAARTTREIVDLILRGGLNATEVARTRGYSPVEVAHAVNWIEAHPRATGYEEDE